MKLTAISLFILSFIFSLSTASALEFTFNHPNQASMGENFSVSISASTSDVYDVKIFIQDNETEVILSEIYNNGWKNPFYYIKEAFPSQLSFLIKVKNYSDNAIICARLRKTGSSSYSEQCGAITLSGETSTSTTSSQVNNSEQGAQTNTTSSSNQTSQTKQSTADFIKSNSSEIQETETNSEKIYLSSKGINKNEVFVTKEEKTRMYIVYSFAVLVVLMLIYLAFKKL